MKHPSIYTITDKTNGMRYVGKDMNPPTRSNAHLSGNSPTCRMIHNAIQKRGRDNFDVSFIYYPGASPEALYAIEQWKIRQLNTLSPNGYNLIDRGPGGSVTSDETRKLMSEKRKGEGNSFYGKNHSDTTIQTISDKAKERVRSGRSQLCDSDWQRKNNPFYGRYATLLSHVSIAKYKVVFQYCVLIPKAYWHALNTIHKHRKLTREGFFDQDIQDTSNASQPTIF